MLETISVNEQLNYEKLSPEEMEKRGILGRLAGPCADIINSTRNGRKYSEALWEAVFENPIMKEKFERGGVFGECGHPADRSEVDFEKIAICMPQPPKKDKSGKLIAIFDILATPCGKILKTLCDYGYKIGISSRGTGETYTDENGEETVDPDTYDCECFDAVLIPAVKAATLMMVESFDDKKLKLKKALCEALDNASDEDRKIMKDKLDELNIDYTTETGVDNIDGTSNKEEADDIGAELVEEFQKKLQENRELEKKVTELQEKLSVCYTKEMEDATTIERYKNSIITLTPLAKQSKTLKEQLKISSDKIKTLEKTLSEKDETIGSLNEQLEDRASKSFKQSKQLRESVKQRDDRIVDLNESIQSLKEALSEAKENSEKEKQQLMESIEEMKKDSQIQFSEYSKKLTKANKLVEKYKTVAKASVEKYISSQALRLGVSPNEIKNKLSEHFSFDEIDSVCESLQEYKINFSKLPFNISKQEKVKVKVTESIEPIKPANRFDDDLDEQLQQLAGLN